MATGRLTPPAPLQPGLHVFDDYPLAELVECIDWTPFFNAWELAGKFPAILDRRGGGRAGQQAVRRRARDAQAHRRRNGG